MAFSHIFDHLEMDFGQIYLIDLIEYQSIFLEGVLKRYI